MTKRRFILHNNTLIERATGLRWHIPDELMCLLDLKQITIKRDYSPPLEKPSLVTIHDLPPNLRASAKVKGAPGQGYFLI